MASTTLGPALRRIHQLYDSGRLDDLADGQLLDRYRGRGDDLAFEVLVARHGPMVRATCRALIRDPGGVDDAFQATFLALVRRGATVRAGETLAGWLHRVAHRVAVGANVAAARRLAVERRGRLDRSGSPGRTGPAAILRDEAAAAVHDELARLPDRFRLPVVLCHLEGKTHAQAAFELGCGEATVRRRLVVARDRLRRRLARRGVAPAPALLALARPPLALGPARFEAASRASTAAVSALAAGAARGLVLSGTWRSARVVLGLIATLGIGLAVGIGSDRPDPQGPPRDPVAAPEAGAEPQAEVALGLVRGPGGRPVAGASIRLREFGDGHGEPAVDPPPLATTDASGRFEVRLPPPKPRRHLLLVAQAPGFGAGWEQAGAGDLAIDLPEDRPLEGQILDLEGRPVAGAEVGVSWTAGLPGGVESFLATVRADAEARAWLPGDNPSLYGRLPGQPSYVRAGPDGRFRMLGIGRDRLVELVVRGPAIAEGRIFALNREMDPVVGPASTRPQPDPVPPPLRLLGSPFRFAAEPSRPIEGVVRDRSTGRPLAGVRITSPRVVGKALDGSGGPGPVSDAAGRFAFPGHPKAALYHLDATPPPGSDHLAATIEVADTPGLGPIRVEILATPGIPFRIGPTRDSTGEPIEVEVTYHALKPNPHVKSMIGSGNYPDELATAARQPDGSYTGVALPGPGAICIADPTGRSLRTRIDPRSFFQPDRKPNPEPGKDDEDPEQELYGNAIFLIVEQGEGVWYLPLEEFADILPIDPKEGSGPIERAAKLSPSLIAAITVLGPDGRPLAGGRAWGADAGSSWSRPLPEADFRATGLDPLRPRKLVVRHDARRLAGQAVVPGPKPATITLQPWATARGRLVDAAGKPRPGLRLFPPGPGRADPADAVATDWAQTDAEGRFRLEGLVPGLRHRMAVLVDGSFNTGSTLFEGLILRAGEDRDLGDVRVESDRPQP